MAWTFRIALVAWAGLAEACSVKTFPPPAPPPAVMPDVSLIESPPVEVGQVRVVIDTDIPARVVVASRYTSDLAPSTTSPLCASTPCVVTLGHGWHELTFKGLRGDDRESVARIEAQDDTLVVNHHLGLDRSDKVSPLAAGFFIGGGLILAALPFNDELWGDSTTGTAVHATVGGILILAGAAQLMSMTRTVREGATTTWSPQLAPAPELKPAASFSLRPAF